MGPLKEKLGRNSLTSALFQRPKWIRKNSGQRDTVVTGRPVHKTLTTVKVFQGPDKSRYPPLDMSGLRKGKSSFGVPGPGFSRVPVVSFSPVCSRIQKRVFCVSEGLKNKVSFPGPIKDFPLVSSRVQKKDSSLYSRAQTRDSPPLCVRQDLGNPGEQKILIP